jgi:glycosyltransferase involved in cell wall biosynthesis
MGRMKIAVWHNLPSGGGKRALYYHIRGLIQRGHTVEAWCPTTADQKYLPLNSLIKEHVRPMHWKDVSASQSSLFEKTSWALFAMSRNIKTMDDHCRRCAEEINQGGFDLLFANPSLFMAVSPIARYVKIRKVLYLHEPLRQLYEAMPKWPWIPPDLPSGFWKKPDSLIAYLTDVVRIRYSKVLAKEEWLNINAYDAVLANSFFSRESLLRAYGVDARVCYLGIDTDLFTARQQQRENMVVGVGSFNPTKNIEFAIKSLARVGNPRPRLIWIGNYSFPQYLDRLQKLASSLHVDFEAKEMVTDDELIDIYNRAAMMVYAPRLEPFGFVPLEANACGLPVVAVAEGGVRETVIDGMNGLLVEPDEKAMASAIERIRDDNDYAYTLGQNGRKIVVEKWSLNASIDRIEKCLEDVIQGKPGALGSRRT